jgi:beta-propeller repeat-containing protein
MCRVRHRILAILIVGGFGLVVAGRIVARVVGVASSATDARTTGAEANDPFGRLPLGFERNDGQTDPRVAFVSRGGGYTLFLTATEAVMEFHAPSTRPSPDGGHVGTQVLRVVMRGANPHAPIEGEGELPGRANYFAGREPSRWRTNVPTYSAVRYRDVYPGIDLVYYGTSQRQLEYDFVLAPGADPDRIALDFDGASSLALDRDGNLTVGLADGSRLVQRAPVVYQERDGRREPAEGRCVLRDGGTVGFELAQYDRARPVYIDPGLIYSTYLGGSGPDSGQAIAIDADGSAYVTGITDSADFPTTAGAVVTKAPGGGNMFVTKLTPDGTGAVYSTYLGGDALDNFESGRGIAVDGAGSAYVTGEVGAGGDFPTTAGAFQRTFGGGYSDVYVTKLTPDGSALAYSTFLGGGDTDESFAIAVDPSGAAYVTGDTVSTNVVCKGIALPIPCCTGFHAGTCNFPTTAGAFQTTNNAGPGGGKNAFVAKLIPSGSALAYSTYLGGTGTDKGTAIAVDATGHAYVTGNSASADFPTTPGAFRTTKPSEQSIWTTPFVTKLTADGTGLAYSTFLGGSQPDLAAGIAVDGGGSAYVTGTTSSIDFPTTPGAFQTKNRSMEYYNLFVSKLAPSGSGLAYSTYVGGTDGTEQGFAIAVDATGHAYVTGRTNSGDFPTTADAYQGSLSAAGGNAVLAKLRADGSGLVYSTYFGGTSAADGDFGFGIAVDGAGNAYVTGVTDAIGFPITAGAFQTTGHGSTEVFATKFSTPTEGPTTTTTTLTPVSTTTLPGGATTTTIAGATTTTTTLACRTPRCTLARLPSTPACAGQTLPATVTKKLDQAASLIDQAASSPAKQARRLLKHAKTALKQAAAKATRAAKGKHPKLSPACAHAVTGVVGGVLGGLGL